MNPDWLSAHTLDETEQRLHFWNWMFVYQEWWGSITMSLDLGDQRATKKEPGLLDPLVDSPISKALLWLVPQRCGRDSHGWYLQLP
jgi:hypothetical protein